MDKFTKQEQDKALLEYEEKQNKKIFTGKILMIEIIIITLLSPIIMAVILHSYISLFGFLIEVVFLILLYKGIKWVKYLYAVIFLLSSINNMMVLYYNNFDLNVNIIIIIFSIIILINSILLFTSKSINEFIYNQRY